MEKTLATSRKPGSPCDAGVNKNLHFRRNGGGESRVPKNTRGKKKGMELSLSGGREFKEMQYANKKKQLERGGGGPVISGKEL